MNSGMSAELPSLQSEAPKRMQADEPPELFPRAVSTNGRDSRLGRIGKKR